MFSIKRKLNNLIGKKIGYHESDPALVAVIFIIIAFGLISLSSASSVMAYSRFGDAYHYFKNQLFGLSLGLVAFWIFSRADYRIWKNYAFHFLLFSIFLLLLVFIPGLSANWGEARSWINIFGYSLQPSEIVKLSFLLYLAAWLEKRKKDLGDISQGIGPFMAVLGFVGFLMILQPDIGTLSIIAITSLVVYFIGGGHVKHIILIVLIGIIGFSIMIQFKPYQLNRFKCMMDPDFSRDDICYQTNQSLIAVGSGGILGRGLGASRQKFMYLPEVSGDAIFAIIAEEVGLIFSSFLVLCFGFLFYRGFQIAKHAPDDFGQNLAIGIVSWLTLQAIINISGMINIMPMTGVPLPLVSYGGSSVLAALSALGVLVNISKQTKVR